LGGTGGHANIAWDPTGRDRLLVVASVAGKGTPVVVDLAAGTLTPLGISGLDIFTAIWSRDGQTIAFVGNGAPGRGIWTFRPDGSALQQVQAATQTVAAYTSIDWSPDSRRLAYTRIGDAGKHDVFVLDL